MSSLKSPTAACQDSQTCESKPTARHQFTETVSDEQVQQRITADSHDCPSSDHLSVKLPDFEHFLRHPSIPPITELGGCPGVIDADQLETERADFQDIPAQFRQNFAWPSMSDTKSSSTMSDNKDGRDNKRARDCCAESLDYKSTESLVSKKKDIAVDDDSQAACSAVAASTTECLTSSSHLLQQLTLLSRQLTSQVTHSDRLSSGSLRQLTFLSRQLTSQVTHSDRLSSGSLRQLAFLSRQFTSQVTHSDRLSSLSPAHFTGNS